MCSRTKEVPLPTRPINWSLPLYRVKAGRPKEALVICRDMFCFDIHYHDGRNWSCQGEEECLLCSPIQAPKRFAAAIVVANRKGSNRHVVPITQSAARYLEMIKRPESGILGAVIHMGRCGPADRSEMSFTLIEFIEYTGLVYSKDMIRELVDRIFGQATKRSDGQIHVSLRNGGVQ